MAHPDPALALRVPSAARREGPERPEPDDERPQLRLVVTRGRLEIELARRFVLAPLKLHDAALSLPDVRFPVELSGGVASFRNRRGRLERLELSLSVGDAQRYAEARWRKLMAGEIVHQLIAPLEDGWLVGLATEESALAFEVLLAPHDGDLRLVPTAARGLGLPAPPQAIAVQALHVLFKPHAMVVGGAVVVESAPALLARMLLPLAGVRAPDARGLTWSEAVFEVGEVWLRAERERAPWTAGARALRALELAALVADAEKALLDGDLESARRGYLDALTRAPRHPELARRLAEVDRTVGDRAEAALATVTEAMPPVEAGPLGAALLAAVGERHAARNAFTRVAEQEPYSALAALCWMEAARASDNPSTLDEALDEAVARAPTMAAPRWQRFERHVRAGRLREARGESAHLEAAARTAPERYRVAERAALLLASHHAYEEASAMYERALRYAPDSAEAVAGLARALGALGHGRRSLELMGRALALAERKRQPQHSLRVAYACLVAEQIDDRPLAIAQVRAIPPYAPETFEARLLEARWRAEIGDLSGASEALARLHDAVESVIGGLVGEPSARGVPERLWSEAEREGRWPSRDDARAAIAQLLLEGARIHEIDRRDVAAARRLLALAVRLAPRRGPIQSAFARLAAVAPEVVEVKTPTPKRLFDLAPASTTLDVDAGTVGMVVAAADEHRAEELTAALRANPRDPLVVGELCEVLARLGRDHDLLALLSARIEEAEPDARPVLLARRAEVLDRMVARARAEGRHEEAALYQSLREADG